MENTDLSIKRGDLLPVVVGVLRDAAGAPVDLTGSTVIFNLRNFITGAMVVSNVASFDPDQSGAQRGIATYEWVNGDTDLSGYYFAEWEVDKGGLPQTYPTSGYNLIVIEQDLDDPLLSAVQYADIRRLRSAIGEVGSTEYSDSLLRALLLRNDNDVNQTAADIWGEKAAAYAELVDVSEAGSSRKLSQLYDRAIAQAGKYQGLAGETDVTVILSNRPRTRPIVRPDAP